MTEKLYSMREILDAAVKEIERAQKGPAVVWHKKDGFVVAVFQGSIGEIWDAPIPATVKELAGLLMGLSEKSWFDDLSMRSLLSVLSR